MRSHCLRFTLCLVICLGAMACKSNPPADKPAETSPPVATSPEAPSEPAAPATPPEKPEEVADNNTYKIGEWALAFSPKKAVLKQGAKEEVVFDAAADTRDCLDGREEGNEEGFEYSLDAKLLFVTDEVFGYEQTISGYCGGAHPFGSTNFVVKRPGSDDSPKLTDFAEAEAIMAALDADELVKQARTDEELCLDAPESAEVTNFAIKDVKDGSIEVMIVLNYSAEVCRSAFGVVTITVPAKSKDVLAQLSSARDKGMLMQQMHPGYTPK